MSRVWVSYTFPTNTYEDDAAFVNHVDVTVLRPTWNHFENFGGVAECHYLYPRNSAVVGLDVASSASFDEIEAGVVGAAPSSVSANLITDFDVIDSEAPPGTCPICGLAGGRHNWSIHIGTAPKA
jgi:hypothetical protein